MEGENECGLSFRGLKARWQQECGHPCPQAEAMRDADQEIRTPVGLKARSAIA